MKLGCGFFDRGMSATCWLLGFRQACVAFGNSHASFGETRLRVPLGSRHLQRGRVAARLARRIGPFWPRAIAAFLRGPGGRRRR